METHIIFDPNQPIGKVKTYDKETGIAEIELNNEFFLTLLLMSDKK